MSPGGTASPNGKEMERSVSDLYAAWTDLAARAARSNRDLPALHRGLWGPDTKTDREGLERANRTLVQGCRLGPGRRVLDAGCGVGGTAVALAEAYGVRVTGVTNCEPHVAVATRYAEMRGVGHLVRFRYGDFMDLPFADASFDAVLNHESFCYADDKLAYLQGVYRVLEPGGRWQALEGLLSGAPTSEEHRVLLAAVQRNWRLPPIDTWRDVLATLEEAGFTDIEEQDLSAEAAPSTDRIRNRFLLFSFLNPHIGETNPAFQEFMDASVCHARGLSEGLFTYRFLSGTRPAR